MVNHRFGLNFGDQKDRTKPDQVDREKRNPTIKRKEAKQQSSSGKW